MSANDLFINILTIVIVGLGCYVAGRHDGKIQELNRQRRKDEALQYEAMYAGHPRLFIVRTTKDKEPA
jgi:hypothetical protein